MSAKSAEKARSSEDKTSAKKMVADGKPMAEVFGISYIVEFNVQKDAYMEYEGHMEKFQQDRAFSSTYEFHTPSGIKRIKYVDLHIYIPLDVQTAIETKERTRAASYKGHKTLESYEYGHLIRYFPDEKDKWKLVVKETKGEQTGHGYETFSVAKYERISQGGGRRKQPKKGSRKARLRANSTRRY